MAVAVENPTKFTFPTLFSRFYGSALPRPYVVDSDRTRSNPPTANGALLEWAAAAHWNMGGLNLKKTKLQGKIEGKLDKLDKEQKKRSSSSGKKTASPAKKRRQHADSDEEDEKVLEGMETEDESDEGERDSEDEESDLDLDEEEGLESQPEEAEEDKPSHIRSRTRSGSKKAQAKVQKALDFGEVESCVNESIRAESSGPAPAVPAGSGRTRQLRKRIAATPRTSVSTRSGQVRTPSSAKSDAKGPARSSGRTPPVALRRASSPDREEETEDDEADNTLSDSSDDETPENEDQYPATDEEDECEI